MSFPVNLSPELLEKANSLGIKSYDIDERHVIGGGKGGQKINKTASCVLLRHTPTGTMVRCQKHREQSKNRTSAYKLLILKIEEQKLGKESEAARRIFRLRKQKKRRSRRAKEKIVADKRRRGRVKVLRGRVDGSLG